MCFSLVSFSEASFKDVTRLEAGPCISTSLGDTLDQGLGCRITLRAVYSSTSRAGCMGPVTRIQPQARDAVRLLLPKRRA